MINVTRRRFLSWLSAPLIVSAVNIMPIKPPKPVLRKDVLYRVIAVNDTTLELDFVNPVLWKDAWRHCDYPASYLTSVTVDADAFPRVCLGDYFVVTETTPVVKTASPIIR